MTRALDTLLDRAVVPGYSKLGYLVRRTWWPDDDPRPGSLAGKRALVTGASSGLGQQAALGLARLGAAVHLLVRDGGRGRAAADAIAAELPEAELHVEVCDVWPTSWRPGCPGSTYSCTTRAPSPPHALSLRTVTSSPSRCTCWARC